MTDITHRIATAFVVPDIFRPHVERFIEFFAATIRNANTRKAYARAVCRFANWCEDQGLILEHVTPVLVACYVEMLCQYMSRPSVKQHLAAIRQLLDYLVSVGVIASSPAASVKGPKHIVRRGVTTVITGEQAKQLLNSIDTTTVAGSRDCALLGVMVYTFARVSSVCDMVVKDYCPQGKRWWFRLRTKGGKIHEVPAHHVAERLMDDYMIACGIDRVVEANLPLFRKIKPRRDMLADKGVTRHDVLAMVKKRAEKAGLPSDVCCHTFRATGITAYLQAGGDIETARKIACHEDAKTTKLYDRTEDEITLDEIERIML